MHPRRLHHKIASKIRGASPRVACRRARSGHRLLVLSEHLLLVGRRVVHSHEQVDQGVGYVAVADDPSDEGLSVLNAEGDDEYTFQEPQMEDVTDEKVVLDADVT